ncbi:MAG TPA: hypothetical protein VK837_13675 [Longimicrobiales bacterium]|nr:hypothetical protein [Longimicrobiales bacterium]
MGVALLLRAARWLDVRRRETSRSARTAATEARARRALGAAPQRGTVRAHALTSAVVELTGIAPDRERAEALAERVRAAPGIQVVIDRIEEAP